LGGCHGCVLYGRGIQVGSDIGRRLALRVSGSGTPTATAALISAAFSTSRFSSRTSSCSIVQVSRFDNWPNCIRFSLAIRALSLAISGELALLQAFGEQPYARAVSMNHVEIIGALAAKNEQVSRERVGIEILAGQRRQAVEALAHAHWRKPWCRRSAQAWHILQSQQHPGERLLVDIAVDRKPDTRSQLDADRPRAATRMRAHQLLNAARSLRN